MDDKGQLIRVFISINDDVDDSQIIVNSLNECSPGSTRESECTGILLYIKSAKVVSSRHLSGAINVHEHVQSIFISVMMIVVFIISCQ